MNAVKVIGAVIAVKVALHQRVAAGIDIIGVGMTGTTAACGCLIATHRLVGIGGRNIDVTAIAADQQTSATGTATIFRDQCGAFVTLVSPPDTGRGICQTCLAPLGRLASKQAKRVSSDVTPNPSRILIQCSTRSAQAC